MADQLVEKILGKFTTEADLDKALGEIHTKVLGTEIPMATFADVEAKKKAYTAYEKKQGSTPPPPPPPPAPPKPPVATDGDPSSILTIGGVDDDPDLDGVLVKAGLVAAEVNKQWLDKGELTPEQYAKLKAAGYGRKMADTLASGQHARALVTIETNKGIRAKAIAVVGGEEAFKNLNIWFAANHPDRVPIYEKMVKANPEAYPEVIRMMLAEHTTSQGAGKAKPLVTGEGTHTGSGGVSTRKEYLEDVAKMKRGDKAAAERLNALSDEQRAALIK